VIRIESHSNTRIKARSGTQSGPPDGTHGEVRTEQRSGTHTGSRIEQRSGTRTGSGRGRDAAEAVAVEGHEIAITNPDKLLWPEAGITKLDYLRKLAALSPYLLKYCRDRYLTVIRYPNGIHGKSFYQKNCPEPVPAFVRTAVLGGVRYVVLDNVPTLLWLGNLACLEFHPSFHYVGDERPAEWVLDLDPSLERDGRIMEAAAIVGDLLRSLGLDGVPKTSGATGIQIYVPIRPGYSFGELRRFGRFIAEYLTATHPQLFTVERMKKDRGDKIYFDYLQHWPGKTLAAPYTPRARPEATLSTPLTWEELRAGFDVTDFNLFTIEARLRERGDLIERVPPQSLDAILAHVP
jgi:bifunctional non-homologous end joining protein LigD